MEHFIFHLIKVFVLFSIEVLCHNPPLSGLPDHALPVLNHDQTDHNTKPMERCTHKHSLFVYCKAPRDLFCISVVQAPHIIFLLLYRLITAYLLLRVNCEKK